MATLTRCALVCAAWMLVASCSWSEAGATQVAAERGDQVAMPASGSLADGTSAAAPEPALPAPAAADQAAQSDAPGVLQPPIDPPAVDMPDDAAPAAGEYFHANAVGIWTTDFVDSSRGVPEVDGSRARDSRKLPTDVLYPAQMDPADMHGDHGNRPQLARDATPDASGAPYPLVIFVHGSISERTSSQSLQRAAAQAGYVAVAADFPLTSLASSTGPSDAHADQEVGDIQFLVDQLWLQNNTPGTRLFGLLDAERYVVVGHSTGATVALVAQLAPLQHDDRMQAAVAMAPATCFFGDALFLGRARPLLIMGGTNDHIVPFDDNVPRPYALARGPKLLLTFVGGKHVGFTDYDIDEDLLDVHPSTERSELAQAFSDYRDGHACADVHRAEQSGAHRMPFEQQHRGSTRWTVAFLDYVFHGRSDQLSALQSDAGSDVSVAAEGL